MFCRYCGRDMGNHPFCPNCTQQTTSEILLKDATHYSEQNQIADVPNIFLIILAFFVPLFGFIYYLTQIAKSQKKSRVYGISALCGVGASLIVGLISIITAMF